ncbi:MAG: acyl-CoA synthetase [Candidatus Rokubacteria bacterium]|nr:acyl-CoA synthetase [Candidatus Rokubacteria bacterium]
MTMDRYLPPRALWPERVYTLAEHRAYPARFNSTEVLLDRHVEAGHGDRTAVLFEDRRITYRALQEDVNRLGSALRGLGVEEDDRVLLRAPSIPPSLVANFAIIKIGAVSVPISPLFSRVEIAHVARATAAKAILVAASLLEEVERAREDLDGAIPVIVIGGDPAEIRAKGFISYGELLARGDARLAAVPRDRLAPSVLLFTSGTTGMPKGTVHLMDEALTVADGFGRLGWRLTPEDVLCSPAPLSTAAGYSAQAVIPFRLGAPISLLARFSPEGMLQQIERHRVSVVSVLPTGYRKILELPDAARRHDLGSVRLYTGGGESLTPATYEQWRLAFGREIYEGLGTTEMMFVFASSAVTGRVKVGAIGPAVPGYELRVVDEDGRDCKPGEVGSLIARGPTGTIYWNDLERQRAAVEAGWSRIGDLVTMDEDGYISFLSREDDIIKSSGYRIGPDEVEQALAGHSAVADVGVIGIPHAVHGEDTCAFIVLQPGSTDSPALRQEIIDSCRGTIAVYKLPRVLRVVERLPRAPGPAGPGTGKLLRRLLREMTAR